MSNPAQKMRVVLKKTLETSNRRLHVLVQVAMILECPKDRGLVEHASMIMRDYRAWKLADEAKDQVTHGQVAPT